MTVEYTKEQLEQLIKINDYKLNFFQMMVKECESIKNNLANSLKEFESKQQSN